MMKKSLSNQTIQLRCIRQFYLLLKREMRIKKYFYQYGYMV